MKQHLFRKTGAMILSAALLLSGTSVGMPLPCSVSAADKARVSVHDPSVFKGQDGTYYVFGSHIEAARSTDLQNWSRFTNGYTTPGNAEFGDLSGNLKQAFDWAGENLEDCAGSFAVWAPDVIWNPDYLNADGSRGAYLMYFCTSSTYMRSVIGFAAAQKPEGPYTFVDTLIYSGFTENDSYATSSTKNVNRKYTSTNVDELIAAGQVTYNSSWFSQKNYNNYLFPNAIDPTIYYGTDGKMYMCYGSWSGGIFTLEMDPQTGRCIHPKSGQTADGRMIDSYFGTKLSGGCYKSGEGPFIEYNPDTGYYYLWVTYGGLTSAGGYNMRVFRSESPTGPFTDPSGKPAVLNADTELDSVGLKVMGNYKFSCLNRAYMACGHNSVLRDDDGRWYLFYHARFDDGTEYHEVRTHAMYFNAEGWPVTAPFEYSGDVLAEAGYDPVDLAGSYEFLNHGSGTDGNIIQASRITLTEDGTITGAASGTWSQAEDSGAAVFTIGGQKYSGYFLAAQDESGKKVLSFTAVGSNNQTIWGAQTTPFTGRERAPLWDYTDPACSLVYAPDTLGQASSTVYAGETELLSGVSYFITNKFSGKLLDLADGKTEQGNNIQQWEKNGSFAQQWRIVSQEDGYCRIVSLGDESKCLAAAQGSAENGINIELQAYTGAEHQLWKLVKNGAYYGILSKCSGDAAGLDVYDWSTENGGNINQWEYWGGDCQLWQLTPVHPAVPDGTYTIRNLNSGLYLSQQDHSAVQDGAQSWTLTRQADGTYLVQDHTGKALTVKNGSADNGADLILSAPTGGTEQKFTLQCNKDGSYSLLTAASGGTAGADVFEISKEPGARICQWEYWGGDGQKFILEPVSAASPAGDINQDGICSAADAVLLQRWLLKDPAAALPDWNAGDLNRDGVLTGMDLCLLKRLLINA